MPKSPASNEDWYGYTEGDFKDRKKKKGEFWCDVCDAALLGDYGKCPNCGATKVGKIRYNKGNSGLFNS